MRHPRRVTLTSIGQLGRFVRGKVPFCSSKCVLLGTGHPGCSPDGWRTYPEPESRRYPLRRMFGCLPRISLCHDGVSWKRRCLRQQLGSDTRQQPAGEPVRPDYSRAAVAGTWRPDCCAWMSQFPCMLGRPSHSPLILCSSAYCHGSVFELTTI